MKEKLGFTDNLKLIASQWHQANPSRSKQSKQGVVLIWHEERFTCAYGWKDSLRDPHQEKPGAFAVDMDGVIYQAEGGNDYDGAQHWVKFDDCDSK